jgi:hypothetical protein
VPVAFPNGDVAVLGTYFQNGSLGKNSQKLWVTPSTDGGRTFTAPQLVLDMQSLPVPGLRTGDTVPSFAADGTLYATWQDIRFSNGKRTDVLVTSSTDEGLTWSMPVKANDTPAGAQDAFTPAVAVDTGGRVGILYYDLRADPSTKDGSFMTTEWFTMSTDGGPHVVGELAGDADVRPCRSAPGRRILPGRLSGTRHRRYVLPAVLRCESGAPGERGTRIGRVLHAD